VIMAGYSAVSEAFVLGKPVFVVPVSGHAETICECIIGAHLGLGFVADEATVLDQLLTMYERDEWVGLHHPVGPFEIDGAREACEAIRSFLKKERVSQHSFAGPVEAMQLQQHERKTL